MVAVGATVEAVGATVVVVVRALATLDRLVDALEEVVEEAFVPTPPPDAGLVVVVVIPVVVVVAAGVEVLDPWSSAAATCISASELTLASTTAAAVRPRTLLCALATSRLGPNWPCSVLISVLLDRRYNQFNGRSLGATCIFPWRLLRKGGTAAV